MTSPISHLSPPESAVRWLPMAPTPRPLEAPGVHRFQALLWEGLDVHARPLPGVVYAVLDGAAADATVHLPTLLWDLGVEHAPLYEGALAPDMAAVAPYLVRLERNTAATRTLLARSWNSHWAVFARSAVDFRTLRRHFRQFLLVHDKTGRRLYFRYYDPRVLPNYVESCTVEERRAFFGPVLEFSAQDYPVRNRPGPSVVRLALDEAGTVPRRAVAMVRPRLASDPPELVSHAPNAGGV